MHEARDELTFHQPDMMDWTFCEFFQKGDWTTPLYITFMVN